MASGSTSGASTPAAISAENWAEITSYVKKLGQETEQLRLDLATTATLPSFDKPKLSKPTAFFGRAGAIDAWASHMDTYVAKATPGEALLIATSYLQGEAFSWWQTHAGKADISDWPTLREALKVRFNPLNKVQAARDLLHKWKQMKDVASYNKSFQSIVLDIPDITMTEQVDRYSRGLKSYIWEALCLKRYDTLDEVMLDALKVEAAKRGVRRISNTEGTTAADRGPAPMDIAYVRIVKLTPEERQRCMREGLCLRCRTKGHMAKDCPKGRGN